VSFLEIEPGSDFVPFRVVVFANRSRDLMACLESAKVQTRSFFYPLHRQPALERFARDENFPAADFGWEYGICLPIYPELKREEVDYICDVIMEFYASNVL